MIYMNYSVWALVEKEINNHGRPPAQVVTH